MAVTPSAAVAGASAQPVVAAGAARIGAVHSIWPFLPTTSSVVDGKALAFAELHYNSVPPASATNELADYLVLSTCGHALDGWRYLSQAALALISGARNNALHLAYYAELRAALSILAGAGIGILKAKHFALTASGQVNWFSGTTHKTAWTALAEWAKETRHALKVIKSFEALGIPAGEWAEACNAAPSLDLIAGYWLQDWSVDLSSLGGDSLLRNEATYRPDLRSTAFDQLARSELEFVNSTSSGCAFCGDGRFECLDLVLMFDLCLKASELRFGESDHRTLHKVWNDVFAWLRNHKRMDRRMAAGAIKSLVSAACSTSGSIVRSAAPTNVGPVGVMSRAFLLLRLASALVRQQWAEIRMLSGGGTSAWQSKALASFGLWSNLWEETKPPADYSILDADRIAAEEGVETWLAGSHSFAPHTVWREIPSALVDLCRFERVGILAVAP